VCSSDLLSLSSCSGYLNKNGSFFANVSLGSSVTLPSISTQKSTLPGTTSTGTVSAEQYVTTFSFSFTPDLSDTADTYTLYLTPSYSVSTQSGYNALKNSTNSVIFNTSVLSYTSSTTGSACLSFPVSTTYTGSSAIVSGGTQKNPLSSGALLGNYTDTNTLNVRSGATIANGGVTVNGGGITCNYGDVVVNTGTMYVQNGLRAKSPSLGSITNTTSNFYTFPENGIYLFMMSVGGSSSNTISISDNLTHVHMVAVCDGYPAQVGAAIVGTNGNYFSLSNGSNTKAISFTQNSNWTYNYYWQKLF